MQPVCLLTKQAHLHWVWFVAIVSENVTTCRLSSSSPSSLSNCSSYSYYPWRGCHSANCTAAQLWSCCTYAARSDWEKEKKNNKREFSTSFPLASEQFVCFSAACFDLRAADWQQLLGHLTRRTMCWSLAKELPEPNRRRRVAAATRALAACGRHKRHKSMNNAGRQAGKSEFNSIESEMLRVSRGCIRVCNPKWQPSLLPPPLPQNNPC